MENSLSDAHVTHDQVGGICIAVFQCDTSGNLVLHMDAKGTVPRQTCLSDGDKEGFHYEIYAFSLVISIIWFSSIL